MAIALQELADEFTRQHPNVLITLGGGGSALGETRAAEGRVTLGASTLMAAGDNNETRQAATIAPPLVRIPIGIDGVAIVVHSSNPVASLTLQQLQDIYSGRILDWQEVGGDAGEILLISREDGSGTRSVFESRVMGETPVSLTAVVMPTSQDVAEYAAKNPFAIGYVSSVYLPAALAAATPAAETPLPDAAPAPAVRALAIDGALPTDAAIKSQEYPIIQPLFLVSRGEPRGLARQFIDFTLSPAGQAIVDRYHVRVR
jgi:phosphate transport system substrate-binding protein